MQNFNSVILLDEKIRKDIKNAVDYISLINIAASSERLEILQILKNKLMAKKITQIKNTRIRLYISNIRKEILPKIKRLENKK